MEPIERLAAMPDIPIPYSAPLEAELIASKDKIVAGVLSVMRG